MFGSSPVSIEWPCTQSIQAAIPIPPGERGIYAASTCCFQPGCDNSCDLQNVTRTLLPRSSGIMVAGLGSQFRGSFDSPLPARLFHDLHTQHAHYAVPVLEHLQLAPTRRY